MSTPSQKHELSNPGTVPTGQPLSPSGSSPSTGKKKIRKSDARLPAHSESNAAGAGRTPDPQSASTLTRLKQMLPTVLVIALLGGIGFLGHHYDWKIPRFSELAGEQGAPAVAWCDEHGVPEAECIACNADLMPKGKLYGWCQEHGVHECVLHHPDVAQLPEVPTITQADFDRAARALAVRPRPKNDPGCKMHLRRIQFPSTDAVDKAGIDINLVDRGRIVESIAAAGEIVYDPTRVARLASRAAGTIWRVEKNVGDTVFEGDVLALVDSAQVGRAKAELLQEVVRLRLAQNTYSRLSGIGTAVAGRRIIEAETAVAEAEVAVQKTVQTLINLGLPISYEQVVAADPETLRTELQFLGLPTHIVAGLDPDNASTNLIPIVAPRDGIVVTRDAVAGEVIDTNRMLFTVADTRVMWVVLNVAMEDAELIATGQKIVFQPDADAQRYTGTVTWISTDVDRETRTIRVRGELSNDDGHLRSEMFGSGDIVLREEDNAIVVPSSAIHWEGCCYVAFVRDKDFFKEGSYKVFHTRSVRPGVVQGDTTEIIAGLWPGEVVVTEGSGVLRAELLKGDLGAG